MRKILPFVFVAFASSCFAQYSILQGTGSPTNIYQDGSGNIGMGNASPAANLDVSANGSSAASIIQSDYVFSAGASYSSLVGGSNYFTASRTPESLAFPGPGYTYGTPVIDFSVNSIGQVGIGAAANSFLDLLIHNHGFSSGAYGNPAFGVLDDNNKLLLLGTNSGSSTVPCGALLIATNSTNAYTGPNTAFLIVDQGGGLNPIFAVGGDGVLGIGTSSPEGQLDVVKNNSEVDYMFHIANGGMTHEDLFAVHNDGYVGIGQLNPGASLVEVSDMSGIGATGTPLLLVDNGTPTHPYFMVRGSSSGVNAGIGIDPLALGSTLALNGVGGSALDMYSGSGTGWATQIRFVNSGADIRHVIADDVTSNNMVIYPGYGGGANNMLEVEGSEQVDVNEHILGNAKIDGTVRIGSQQSGAGLTNAVFPNYQLSVDGQIVAQELIVQVTSWSDTVFSETYQLKPLAEVQNYIQQNHHLPDVPNENEVMHGGINVGQMNATLLKKVEELTLYTLNQQKQINDLQQQLKRLTK